MNSSNGSEIYFAKEHWFSLFGSSILLDLFQLLAVLPISLMGALFNFLSYYTLSKKVFQNSVLYSYLRVYTLNSMIVNVEMALLFWPSTLRTFDFSNTYAAVFYKSFIYLPLINATILFGSLMDILISLERLFKFYPHLDTKFTKIPKWKMISIMIVVTILLCVQYLFKYSPSYIEVPLNKSTMFRIYFSVTTPFANSLWGKLMNYLVYFIRDIFCLFAETVLNICVAVLLKQQIKNKLKITNNYHSNRANMSKSEQKASHMVIIMCSLSSLEHIFFFTMAINFDLNTNSDTFLFGLAGDICITLKHGSNLILLYYFNKLFREVFNI